jgi:hypothetical protein
VNHADPEVFELGPAGVTTVERERGGWRRQRPGDGYWALVFCAHEGCDKKATVRMAIIRADGTRPDTQHWCGPHAKKELAHALREAGQ